MKKKIITAFNLINEVLKKTSVGMMIFLLFLTFANVIGRYIFSKSIFFADELARYLFVWIVFLGIANIVKEKRQVAVTLISEKITGIPGLVVESFIALCGLIFLIVLLVGGIQLTQTMVFYSSAALRIPMQFVYVAIPICAGLTLVYHVIGYIQYLSEYSLQKDSAGKEISE